MLMNARILIADDDRELCALLVDYLRPEGFEIEAVHEAASALVRLDDPSTRPDLLILDVMMPGMNGLDALRELRRRHPLPVLMLSARGDPVDRVVGLELGADDYLAKPCLPRELLARVKALLRRRGEGAGETDSRSEVIVIGALSIHTEQRRALIGTELLKLTGAEFGLLLVLARSRGQTVDKATLAQNGLGRPLERFDRSVDVHLSRLRHKLADASPGARLATPSIEAVRGMGYVLVEASGSGGLP